MFTYFFSLAIIAFEVICCKIFFDYLKIIILYMTGDTNHFLSPAIFSK